MSEEKCLYLVSSSASEKYVVDCLEVLAKPRGVIQHFRYRRRHLDESLQPMLPPGPDQLPAELRDTPVVVLFLFAQRTADDEWSNPNRHVPLRCGRLIDAYYEGDVAHIFFVIGGYLSFPPRGSSVINLRDQVEAVSGRYGWLGPSVLVPCQPAEDSTAFQSFVRDGYDREEWRTVVAGTAPLDVTYEIAFFRVAGVYREVAVEGSVSLEALSPQVRHLPGWPIGEFVLEAGVPHYVKIVTDLMASNPAELAGRGQSELRLQANPAAFELPASPSMRIASAYDLWLWRIIPKRPSDKRTELKIVFRSGETRAEGSGFVRSLVVGANVILPITIEEKG